MVVFIVLIWRLDGQPYFEGSLDAWRNATDILATVFPILFAAIASRLLVAAAHWRLERGAPMGILETLMGSRTVGSTIITLF
ncbi:hypothetical protein F5X68DRAFT_206602 [Plectosphaerella plurivora]|uniref:Uncharacterized protein n=1 Tax=Plectosphaerella plurivora TaxID=936078 RepID=A0A9P8VEA8_9PEZI|nr:hypothetical protein F5X68DRAFT_206602 [Plectosphaerella plurivora]